MDKLSSTEVSNMTKLAAAALRSLSGENQDLKAENSELKQKLASYEKREHAEKIATMMEDKGLENGVSFQDKVAGLLKRDDLRVVEEAVSMSSPQMKVASVVDGQVTVEGGSEGAAEANFAASLANL